LSDLHKQLSSQKLVISVLPDDEQKIVDLWESQQVLLDPERWEPGSGFV
jgi:hypothetical protein